MVIKRKKVRIRKMLMSKKMTIVRISPLQKRMGIDTKNSTQQIIILIAKIS